MNVICLVGPSAAGKSTALQTLSIEYTTLKEKYMELNVFHLDNRFMVSKWKYIDYWFSCILQANKDGKRLIITDRCPFDTCAYVSNGQSSLFNCLKRSFQELEELGIYTKFILVTAEFNILENRIRERIEKDPNRINYNELDKSHNRKAYNFFLQKKDLWNNIIDTSNIQPNDVVRLIKKEI